ncbi:MAG: IPT/TIG domain-containing protein [Sandaracinaceae bacterium]|nr:IPT/TIG domain-containing protein [Sandaracinaceae bacterium]
MWIGSSQLEIASRLPNRWTVRVPAGATSGAIEIRTPRGNVTGPRFRVTEAPPAPVVASFEPASGAPGSEVVIRGENFSPRLTENHVHLGALPVVVRSATPNELTVIVPQGAESGPFRVDVMGSGQATSAEAFQIGTGTTIASFEPVMGPPGTRVTIRGTGFSRRAAQNRVYLGEQRARVLRATETELSVELPRRDAVTARLLVDVQRGGRAHSPTEFEIRFPPTIASVDPESGAPGTRITLTGEHFGTDVRQVRATMGETELVVRDLAPDRLVVEIPAGAASGPIEVTVAGLGPARTRGAVTVLEQVAVEGFSPRSGGPGTVVTITGRGFSQTAANNTVRLSGHAGRDRARHGDLARGAHPRGRGERAAGRGRGERGRGAHAAALRGHARPGHRELRARDGRAGDGRDDPRHQLRYAARPHRRAHRRAPGPGAARDRDGDRGGDPAGRPDRAAARRGAPAGRGHLAAALHGHRALGVLALASTVLGRVRRYTPPPPERRTMRSRSGSTRA